MISRQKLLEAAIRVFAESGFRGATTRRIADAAGVNEVTLFRLFKSKSALISEAAQLYARQRSGSALPARPVQPEREVTAWAAEQLHFLQGSRALIRKCMAELEEHPDMAECMRHGPLLAQMQLREYAHRLLSLRGHGGRGVAGGGGGDRVAVACAMLQGALFADAMGREISPELFPQPLARAPSRYARAFLDALGAPDRGPDPAPGNGRSNGRRTSVRRTRRS
jgi:AcrR family transcriptional regulator